MLFIGVAESRALPCSFGREIADQSWRASDLLVAQRDQAGMLA